MRAHASEHPRLIMGRVSGKQIYSGIGMDRAVYERMGAWTTLSDRPDYGRAVLRYEREACAAMAM